MKQVFAYFFLIFFAAMSLQQLSVLTVYVLNQDFIAEEYCVNKEKPELECNGKCHMKDVMAANEEKKDVKFSSEIMIAVYFEDYVLELPSKEKFIDQFYFEFSKELSSAYESKMFQPPQA